MNCSYGKIFLTRLLRSPRSRLPSHTSHTSEISVTQPYLPLIWTHQNFYTGFRGKAGSQKPSNAVNQAHIKWPLFNKVSWSSYRYYLCVFLGLIIGAFSNEDRNANNDGSNKSHSWLTLYFFVRFTRILFCSLLNFVSRKRLIVSPWS